MHMKKVFGIGLQRNLKIIVCGKDSILFFSHEVGKVKKVEYSISSSIVQAVTGRSLSILYLVV